MTLAPSTTRSHDDTFLILFAVLSPCCCGLLSILPPLLPRPPRCPAIDSILRGCWQSYAFAILVSLSSQCILFFLERAGQPK